MDQYDWAGAPAKPETNALGIAGFVVSLVGLLLTGGCLSPVGLVLSIVAVFKAPRGFAIAGIILGVIGSLGFIIAFVVLGAVVLAMFAVIATVGMAGWEAYSELDTYKDQLNAYYAEHGSYPYALDEVGVDLDRLDQVYGGNWAYERSEDGNSFTIAGPGPDGQEGTEDDFRLSVDTTEIVVRVGANEIIRMKNDGVEPAAP